MITSRARSGRTPNSRLTTIFGLKVSIADIDFSILASDPISTMEIS